MSDKGKAESSRTTRDDILGAALETLLERGYEAASMDLVAKRAGVSRRTLFNQFETKEALFRAAVERVWARLPILEITTAKDALDHPALGLTRFGDMVAEFWAPADSIALARMIIREGARFPSLARDYLALGKVPALGMLIAYLEALRSEGHLTVTDPDLAARQFVGLINEPLVWFRVLGLDDAPSAERRRTVVTEAVATFLARYGSSRT